jgi:SAM-dependent methyltransferase
VIWNEIGDSYLAIAEDRDKILLPTLVAIVRDTKAKSVVDVGGGDGRFLHMLHRHFGTGTFSHMALTDPSSRMRRRAKERLAELGGVTIVAEPGKLPPTTWDLVLLIAVWMSIPTDEGCVSLLRDIRSLLSSNGRLVAAVTHPCFRDRTFHSYSTSFDMRSYFDSGTKFKVNLYDSVRSLAVWDTHWSLADHCRQLGTAGFSVDSLVELPDVEDKSEGAPWLAFVARGDQ